MPWLSRVGRPWFSRPGGRWLNNTPPPNHLTKQAERTLFDAIYLVPLQRKDYRSYEKETLCKLMGSAIGFDDASNEREIVFLLQVRRQVDGQTARA